MRTRTVPEGWCPNIRGVLGAPFWPGRLIYGSHTYTDSRGHERVQVTALCPACGKWVDVRWDDTVESHMLPAGTDEARAKRRRDAQAEYGAMVVEDQRRLAKVS